MTEQPKEVLTQDSLIEYFKSQNWKYFTDNEGDLGGMWDNDIFHFMIRGAQKEILSVSGRWHDTIDASRLQEVRMFINKWHAEKLWPKCFHRINDNGDVYVITEVNIDWEQGATKEQLQQHIDCALGTSGQFFKALSEALNV